MSCVITVNIVVALRGKEEFRMADHASYMREGSEEARKRNTLKSEEAMAKTLESTPVHTACRLRRATKTGAWMIVQP